VAPVGGHNPVTHLHMENSEACSSVLKSLPGIALAHLSAGLGHATQLLAVPIGLGTCMHVKRPES
jgi:hypothetical protein